MILFNFRCHSFKKKIEKSDEQLKKYVESITIIVKPDSSHEKQMMQPEQIQLQIQQQQHQQQARPEHHQPIIITNMAHQPSLINNGQQLFHSANGQIIGQFNNAVILGAPVGTQQLLTLPDVNRCELLTADQQFYDEIPIVIQSNNGQHTILNLPHSQLQSLHNHQQQQQQQLIGNQQHTQIQQVIASCEESDEAELQEEYEYEEVDEPLENIEETKTYLVENIEEAEEPTQMEVVESIEEEEQRVIEEFIQNQQNSSGALGKYTCSLCSQEFKHLKWLQSHLKSIHINWIKANCKKQPQCLICSKSFRGPGMLKMHMKTHEKEFKMPTCTVCGKEFKSKSILYRHRATHFASQKNHKCTICDKNFTSNYMLVAHMNRHQKTNQCGGCTKTFLTEGELKVGKRASRNVSIIIKLTLFTFFFHRITWRPAKEPRCHWTRSKSTFYIYRKCFVFFFL